MHPEMPPARSSRRLRSVSLGLIAAAAAGFLAREAVRPAAPLRAEASRAALLADDLQSLFAGVADGVRKGVVFISSTRSVPLPEDPQERMEALFHTHRPQRQRSLGSGVVIDARGYVLTSQHVVGEADELVVRSWDGRSWPARVVQREEGVDLALLQIEAPGGAEAAGLHPVPMGTSESIRVGHWVLAIGSPFGLTQTVSAGIVSAVGRSDLGLLPFESFIQTDASINEGNSGGPLVDLRGRLVGINTAIFQGPCGSTLGIGFAVPIDLAQALVEKWLRGKGSSYLGVEPGRIDLDAARYFGLGEPRGVLVEQVAEGSPADRGGLKVKDIVLRFDGTPVRDESHFRYLLACAEAGEPLEVEALRRGEQGMQKVLLELTLDEDGVEPTRVPAPASSSARTRMLGITVAPLGEEMARQLAIPGDLQGVVVIDVDLDSPADQKGLREGDVIVEANERAVKDIADLQQAIARGGRDGEPAPVVMLRLVRGGKDIGYKFVPR